MNHSIAQLCVATWAVPPLRRPESASALSCCLGALTRPPSPLTATVAHEFPPHRCYLWGRLGSGAPTDLLWLLPQQRRRALALSPAVIHGEAYSAYAVVEHEFCVSGVLQWAAPGLLFGWMPSQVMTRLCMVAHAVYPNAQWALCRACRSVTLLALRAPPAPQLLAALSLPRCPSTVLISRSHAVPIPVPLQRLYGITSMLVLRVAARSVGPVVVAADRGFILKYLRKPLAVASARLASS